MKKNISYMIMAALSAMALFAATSCTKFLEENPKTFVSTVNYFTSVDRMAAAVNGMYVDYQFMTFTGDLGIMDLRYSFLEYLAGNTYNDNSKTSSQSEAFDMDVTDINVYVGITWTNLYAAIENCNSVIAGIEGSTFEMDQNLKNQFLGEAYGLRGFYYFVLTKWWERVPLKLTPTTGLEGAELAPDSAEDVYTSIVSDLQKATELMKNCPWVNNNGHFSRAAVTATLTKVYLTMAGYPLQKGAEYYQKAYEEGLKLINSGSYRLAVDYDVLRNDLMSCTGEYIWCHHPTNNNKNYPYLTGMIPAPIDGHSIVAKNNTHAEAMVPDPYFVSSFEEGDLRAAEGYYFFTKYKASDDANLILDFGKEYIFKFWDESIEQTGTSAQPFPYIRYADVLLMVAEAKACADGGSTNDAAAIDAYWQVRNRAFPNGIKPSSITFEQVYKEREWELCFEAQGWYDIQRTRKIVNHVTGQVVDAIGYTPGPHTAPYEASDFVFPYPQNEVRVNPNLK